MNYLNRIISMKKNCVLKHVRKIITDRIGPLENQFVSLTWECDCEGKIVSITPDEAEILFTYGLIPNVLRGENGKLYQKKIRYDIRYFTGAIVCGILAPKTRKIMRPEIIEYAKKSGYISDNMIPVKMLSGSKSLILNQDGTYNVFFSWNDNINIEPELLNNFTKNLFDGYDVKFKKNGILLEDLSEDIAFSKKSIDMFKIYDIQLFCLDSRIDKTLLLYAIMQIAFIQSPSKILTRKYFEKDGNIAIPCNTQYLLNFNKVDNCHMNCGILLHRNIFSNESYTYCLTVPYTEYIRELMINMEEIIKSKYYNCNVSFSPFDQNINICFTKKSHCLKSDIEREFIVLDYAITLLQEEKNFNKFQLYNSIISLLENDSSGYFKKEYSSYFELLKYVLRNNSTIV